MGKTEPCAFCGLDDEFQVFPNPHGTEFICDNCLASRKMARPRPCEGFGNTRFQKLLDELIGMLEAVKEFDLRNVKIHEPLSVAPNLRLNGAFEILALREQRRFAQAEESNARSKVSAVKSKTVF
jgi:hypothetical protein